MKRYDNIGHINNMEEAPTGNYILFTEHKAELTTFYTRHQIGYCGTHSYGKFNADGCVICQLKADHAEMLNIVYVSGVADGKSGKEAAIKKAVEDEKNRCAEIAKSYTIDICENSIDNIVDATAWNILNKIRSRGATPPSSASR